MRISVDVPENVLQQIFDEAVGYDCNPEQVILNHLIAGMPITRGERYLLVRSADLVSLEDRLGLGQLSTAADLTEKVGRLARVNFGKHEIQLSQAQIEEITWRAKKAGKTIDEMLQGAWRVLQEQLFTVAIGVK